jgi:hypothetical protein
LRAAYRRHCDKAPISSITYGDFVTRIYVHTPERFEFRQVAVGQTFGNLVQVTNGLHDGWTT